MNHREQLAELAEIFISLDYESRVELLNRLGDAGTPAEWLDLMARQILKDRTE
jgi:hypothetical protein